MSDPKKKDITNGIGYHFEHHRLTENDSTNILRTVSRSEKGDRSGALLLLKKIVLKGISVTRLKVFKYTGRWKSPKNPVILCVIHHRQNPSESPHSICSKIISYSE
jgi:hypothetical protein